MKNRAVWLTRVLVCGLLRDFHSSFERSDSTETISSVIRANTFILDTKHTQTLQSQDETVFLRQPHLQHLTKRTHMLAVPVIAGSVCSWVSSVSLKHTDLAFIHSHNNSRLLANWHFLFTQRKSGWTLSAIIDIINLPYSVIMSPLETYNSQ